MLLRPLFSSFPGAKQEKSHLGARPLSEPLAWDCSHPYLTYARSNSLVLLSTSSPLTALLCKPDLLKQFNLELPKDCLIRNISFSVNTIPWGFVMIKTASWTLLETL